jgi:hypothetical protein
MDKKETTMTVSQIVNFVLNISLWQTVNTGFKHKMSMHIQDIIPGFVIEWLVVDNGELSFEGELKDENRREYIRNYNMPLSKVEPEHLEKILETLKNINLFHS